MGKETYMCKRSFHLTIAKKPTKKTYICGKRSTHVKRDLHVSETFPFDIYPETYKRDLNMPENKRPTYVNRDLFEVQSAFYFIFF